MLLEKYIFIALSLKQFSITSKTVVILIEIWLIRSGYFVSEQVGNVTSKSILPSSSFCWSS